MSDTFSDVDRSNDADGAIAWLDRIDSWPQMRAYKQRSYTLCGDAAPALDVGAGTGTDARRMSAFGCDSSMVMCRAAHERDVCMSRADVHALPFRDAAFRAVRGDRVLQHVADPFRALAELIRVCAPGGRVVVCDPDQESLTIHVPGAPAEVVEKVKAMRRDVGTRNGTFVHRIPELLAAAECADITVEAFPLVLTDPDDAFGLPGWARYWGEHFSPEEVAEWERCVANGREGGFVFALLYFVIAATIPSGPVRGTR